MTDTQAGEAQVEHLFKTTHQDRFSPNVYGSHLVSLAMLVNRIIPID